MKNILSIDGHILKEEGQEISEKDVEFIMDEILDVIEKRGYIFAGMWKHLTNEESIEEEDENI